MVQRGIQARAVPYQGPLPLHSCRISFSVFPDDAVVYRRVEAATNVASEIVTTLTHFFRPESCFGSPGSLSREGYHIGI